MKAVAAGALLACSLVLPVCAVAATPSPPSRAWPLAPSRSQVQFSVRKLWLAHERGTFAGMQGTLRRINTHIGADLVQVDAAVAVAGLEMDDADARTRALGPDFFDAAQFPDIRFDSDPFPLSALAAGGTLHGMLEMHGQNHPVTFTLLPSDCPRQPLECEIRAEGAISRSLFGMHGLRGVISDKVHLDLRIGLDASGGHP